MGWLDDTTQTYLSSSFLTRPRQSQSHKQFVQRLSCSPKQTQLSNSPPSFEPNILARRSSLLSLKGKRFEFGC